MNCSRVHVQGAFRFVVVLLSFLEGHHYFPQNMVWKVNTVVSPQIIFEKMRIIVIWIDSHRGPAYPCGSLPIRSLSLWVS